MGDPGGPPNPSGQLTTPYSPARTYTQERAHEETTHAQPQHTYASAGRYTATLTVTYANGSTSVTHTSVQVQPAVGA
ncbi:MAG TPA: PKD domain-containing protein [Streptosporangiaceae bacterium]|nr:PKD domain-containing protein [Streptosporangiaceae bacterium]